MRSVSLVSQKGGAGKTTLAIHLAVLAQEKGRSVVLVDCDPQRSATKWWQRRATSDLTLVTRGANDLAEVLGAACHDGYDFAIIDTAPTPTLSPHPLRGWPISRSFPAGLRSSTSPRSPRPSNS